MAVTPAIKAIADAITAGFQLLSQYKKDKHVTRLRAAVDSAEHYMLENNEPESKEMKKYRKRFFKYNQG